MYEINKLKKPRCLTWICDETRKDLKLKEKDFIVLHFWLPKLSKKEIMRKLYFEDRTSYWKFEKRVKAKIKDDVEKFNEFIQKNLQTVKNR